MPTTLWGFLVLVGVLGPGYAWVRYAERRKPRPSRSGILEAADVIYIGVSATSAALIFLLAARPLNFPAPAELSPGLLQFARDDFWRALGSLASVIALSVVGTLLVARLAYGPSKPRINPGETVWFEVFKDATASNPIPVSIDMVDGRIMEGLFLGTDLEADIEQRDLALQRPIYVWMAGAGAKRERRYIDAERLIVPLSQIVAVRTSKAIRP